MIREARKRGPRTRPRPDAHLFCIEDAAAYLGISVTSFYKALPKLQNPEDTTAPLLPVKFPKIRGEYYRKSDLDRLIESLPIHPDCVGANR